MVVLLVAVCLHEVLHLRPLRVKMSGELLHILVPHLRLAAINNSNNHLNIKITLVLVADRVLAVLLALPVRLADLAAGRLGTPALAGLQGGTDQVLLPRVVSLRLEGRFRSLPFLGDLNLRLCGVALS